VTGVERCGKEEPHDEHAHWRGHCDGQPVDPTLTAHPGVPIATLYGAQGHPRPWTWSSLTVGQARDLVEQLDRFVEHYNATYVVKDAHLVLGCWPLHPGLAHELATLYAAWVGAFCSGSSLPEIAHGWHDRWLPGFQARVRDWFGVGTEYCYPGTHIETWNPAAFKIKAAAKRPELLDVDTVVRGLIGNGAYLDGT
jgi:hypothetical protein